PTSLYAMGPTLVFSACMISADGQSAGTELHWTDGGNVKEFELFGGHDSSYPDSFLAFKDRLVLAATSEFAGRELWTLTWGASGAKPDAELLKDILPPEVITFPLAGRKGR
ncbi:MAG: hypothetical protein IT364_27250, partial [Candidatus Hydrogenedentes bacterium]|nr:hypothetical protein [Candidatus Hydrogenedentota bacterium]